MDSRHCCSCEDHCHEHEESRLPIVIRLISGAILFILALLLHNNFLFTLSYIILGYDVVFKAFKNYKNLFNESFLMTVATFGAFALGEFAEACAVMLFYQIGEFLSDYATDKSKESIGELMDLRSDTAHLLSAEGVTDVLSETVHIGDNIRVLSGEKVPLDGIISKGAGYFDTKSLTGESIPQKLSVGDTVLSGYISNNSPVEITVTKEYADSTASKILALVSDEKRSNSEKFITKFSRIYIPIVVILALLIAVVPVIFGGYYKTWIYRAMLFLVVSCPCALVVSIPLSFFAGIGCASLKGILIKGAFALEKASKIKNFAFDKTGTLTDGKFAVRSVKSENYSENELLKYAAYCEYYSNHPIANAIKEYYAEDIDEGLISDFSEIAGKGILAKIDSHNISVGSAEFVGVENSQKGLIYVSVDGEFAGSILISDEIKNEAKSAISELKKLGISPIILTGDSLYNAESVANELDIPFKASLLPQDKVSEIGKLKKNGVTAFVGDGINDAPVLSNADVGVSMGNIGQDAAIESSDVVLTNDDLLKIPKLIRISGKTMRIVKENIIFSISVKIAVMLLGALGFASIWGAVFADVGVLILAILNSLRAFLLKD